MELLSGAMYYVAYVQLIKYDSKDPVFSSCDIMYQFIGCGMFKILVETWPVNVF